MSLLNPSVKWQASFLWCTLDFSSHFSSLKLRPFLTVDYMLSFRSAWDQQLRERTKSLLYIYNFFSFSFHSDVHYNTEETICRHFSYIATSNDIYLRKKVLSKVYLRCFFFQNSRWWYIWNIPDIKPNENIKNRITFLEQVQFHTETGSTRILYDAVKHSLTKNVYTKNS